MNRSTSELEFDVRVFYCINLSSTHISDFIDFFRRLINQIHLRSDSF